jgi:hypothetical protein
MEEKREGFVLQKTNSDAAFCYLRAEENHRMAECAGEQHKQTYLDLEQRWLKLALSYDFSDRLNQYTANVACMIDRSRNR